MKKLTVVHGVAAAIACLGIVLPMPAMAAPPAAGGIADVTLHEEGTLVGVVYTAQGLPQASMPVSVQSNGLELTRTTTDEQGRFVAQGLKGGVYQLVTTEGVATYRAWTAGTAPPASENAALVVTGDVTRGLGHHHHGGLGAWLSNPWVLAAIVATAIAVPIALHDNDRDSSS